MEEQEATLLLIPWSPDHAGGVSVVVRNLAREFEAAGRRVIVAVDDWAHRTPTPQGLHLHYRFGFVGGFGAAALAKSMLAVPASLLATHRLLRSQNVGAVNAHYPGISVLGIAILKRLGLYRGTLALSYHGTDVRHSSGRIEAWAWRFIFGACDGVTACSAALAERTAATYRLAPSRIARIHNGTDTAVFRPELPALASLPRHYAVSVGRYVVPKGHRLMVKAFARIADRFPDVALVIVGMSGPEREPLIALAQALGLEKRLHCLVDLPPQEVACVVANAKVCVQPSAAESFPLSVLEAGACATPVIASRIAGHTDMIRDGVTGYLYPVDDEAACATAMARVLEHPAAARETGWRLHDEVVSRYTWQAAAAGYAAVLRLGAETGAAGQAGAERRARRFGVNGASVDAHVEHPPQRSAGTAGSRLD